MNSNLDFFLHSWYYGSVYRNDLPDVELYDADHAVWLHWVHLCSDGCDDGDSKTFFAVNIRTNIPADHSLLWDGISIFTKSDGTNEFHHVWCKNS